jgi:glycosyltransferase involved in cell wall biosynthesis
MQETGQERALRVCYFGTYRANYGRNEIMIAALRAQGATVYECHATLWRGIDDRVDQVEGGWWSPRFWGRLLATYARLVIRHAGTPEYDVMVIGYPGPFDAYLGRLLSWWRRRPLVLDHYMSLYLIALERGLLTAQSLKGRLLRRLEGSGLRLPDRLISDTAAYVRYHCQTYGLQSERFDLVPAGADERLYHPHPDLQPPDDRFRVIYYGTFIPNHGVPTIVEAAFLLRGHEDIHFDLFGDGPHAADARRRVQEAQLANVSFHGWVQKERLPQEMARSHLCLGVFGTTPQSLMTVQNKIWEAAAMARPLVTGDSPTVRAAFKHGEED